MFAIDTTMTYVHESGIVTMQIPTFFLDSNVHGIVNEEHARKIAEEIVNPLRLFGTTITAVKVS